MIRLLINLYCFILVVDWIFSYLPQFKDNLLIQKISYLAEFSLRPIRKLLPDTLPVDISPLVVIVGLKLIEALW